MVHPYPIFVLDFVTLYEQSIFERISHYPKVKEI